MTLHTLRHSTASALIAAGEHIKVVQEMLGHSSYAITADIYSHVNVQQQRAGRGAARGGFPVVTIAVATPVATPASSAEVAGSETASHKADTVGLARFELATP